MATKPAFNPQVTRIELNPEQAVLTCSCFHCARAYNASRTGTARATVCSYNVRRTRYCSIVGATART
jgi:hypothetical protein